MWSGFCGVSAGREQWELCQLPDSSQQRALFGVGCTLTIPRLPSEGFKMAKSGVWGRLEFNNPPTSVGGIEDGKEWCLG